MKNSPPKKREGDSLVEMKGVDLQFTEEKKILDGLDLNIGRGERLVILGGSGSGKSTLLRLCLGILRPTNDGTVFFNEFEMSKLKGEKLNRARQKIGMVFQYSALISSLSVRDNLALPLEELTDKDQGEIDQIIDEKLEMVGLADTKNQMPSELSGGMKKRISLARALVLNPELILFDEPSAGLDPINSSLIDDLIISLTEKTKATSVIVTHEMDSAFSIATRMTMLNKGKIIADGTPEKFRESDHPVVKEFLAGGNAIKKKAEEAKSGETSPEEASKAAAKRVDGKDQTGDDNNNAPTPNNSHATAT